MVAEALIDRDDDTVVVTVPAAGFASGEVIQLPDGRASVVSGLQAKTSGDRAAMRTSGKFVLAKAANVVCLKGSQAWWNRAGNVVTPVRPAAGGYFPIGVFLADAASADTSVLVDLNERPRSLIDLHRDEFDSIVVKTVVGSTTVEVPRLVQMGGAAAMLLGTTNEAQKVDLLSTQSLPVTVPFIAEGRIAVFDIGSAAALDINIGVANGTHASDADSITEHCLFHLDGTAFNILAQSKDGTTTVAAADTGVLAVDDTYFQFAIDARDLSNVKLYVNGVRVNSGSTYKLNAATGPLKLLAHVEKSANATSADVRVSDLTLRSMDLAA